MKIFRVLLVALPLLQTRAADERPGDAVRALVEAEKKFYQTGQEQGTRAAFVTYLADDAVVFQPGPVNGHKVWLERKETALDLIWQPAFAAVARSGELGYDTGPAEWKASKAEPTRLGYGEFVSVWKKQKDNSWKVVLDVGIEHPPSAQSPAPVELVSNDAATLSKIDLPSAKKNLRATEKRYAAAATINSNDALLTFAADDLRVLRDGVTPAIGKAAAGLMLTASRGALTLETAGEEMSASGDLAYRYGSYSIKRPEISEKGYFLQVWKTDEEANWRLVLDLQKTSPAPKKESS